MNASKEKSSEISESRKITAIQSDVKGAAQIHAPRRQVQIASCMRYEAYMQELAAEYQRRISAGSE